MITEYGIEAKSNSEIISELGGRFKQYRLFSNLLTPLSLSCLQDYRESTAASPALLLQARKVSCF